MLQVEQYTRGPAPSTVVPYSDLVGGSIYFTRGMVPIRCQCIFPPFQDFKATVEAFVCACWVISYGVNCALTSESV